MARIAERTEQDIDYNGRMLRIEETETDCTKAICHATCTTAKDLNAAAIITVSMSGFTAQMVSKYKPNCQIIGCSVNPRVCRQMNLLWGVEPILLERQDNVDDLFDDAVRMAEKNGLVKKGDVVVVTAGVPLGVSGRTNMLKIMDV